MAGFPLLAFFTTKAVKGGEHAANWRGSAFSALFWLPSNAGLHRICVPVGSLRVRAAPPTHPPTLVSWALMFTCKA